MVSDRYQSCASRMTPARKRSRSSGILFDRQNRFRQHFGIPGLAEIDVPAVLQGFIPALR